MISIENIRYKQPAPETSIELSSLLFFDIETTGLRPDRGAKIVEVAILGRNSEQFYWKKDACKTDHTFPFTKISEHLQRGVVVGHNLGFDFWFVAYEADRVGTAGPNLRFIDTLHLARRILKRKDGFQLGSLLKRFDIRCEGELHTASTDAHATRALFWKLVELGGITTVGEAGMKQLNWSNF